MPDIADAYAVAGTAAVARTNNAVCAWHIEKNCVEPVALTMLSSLSDQIAERGLLMVLCDAAIESVSLKLYAAQNTASHILQSYYYGVDGDNLQEVLEKAVKEAIYATNISPAYQKGLRFRSTPTTAARNEMGISATAVVIHDNKLIVASVGNTSALCVRGHKLLNLSQPVSHINNGDVVMSESELHDGDRILICTEAVLKTVNRKKPHWLSHTKSLTKTSAFELRKLIKSATQTAPASIHGVALLQYQAQPSQAFVPVTVPNQSLPAVISNTPSPASKTLVWGSLAAVCCALAMLFVIDQRSVFFGKWLTQSLPPVASASNSAAPTYTVELIEVVPLATPSIAVVLADDTTATPTADVPAIATSFARLSEPTVTATSLVYPTATPLPSVTASATKPAVRKVIPPTVVDITPLVIPVAPVNTLAAPTLTPAPLPTQPADVSAQPPQPQPQPTSSAPQPTTMPTEAPTALPPEPTSPPAPPTDSPPPPPPTLAAPCPPEAVCLP